MKYSKLSCTLAAALALAATGAFAQSAGSGSGASSSGPGSDQQTSQQASANVRLDTYNSGSSVTVLGAGPLLTGHNPARIDIPANAESRADYQRYLRLR